MKKAIVFPCALVLALGTTALDRAWAHGLAGKRFFPATIAIEDPFVADELSLPSFAHRKEPAHGDEPAVRATEISGELSKRITPWLGLSLEGELNHLDPDGGPSLTGFGNLEVGLKAQVLKNDAHELVSSLSLGWEVGGTGRRATEAESFDRVKPALLFGKGFGDLPDALAALKPLAVTGVFGADVPTRTSTRTVKIEGDEAEIETERHPNLLRYGVAIEYSLPYLQSFVKDVGLPWPLNRVIPLVEIEAERALDRGQAGVTTWTMNPGIIWAGRLFQIGVEAILPMNERTGKNVGVRAQLHFYLDDLFPRTLGRPLFGR